MKALNNAIKDFIEALNHVPGVQLRHIEETLRQLRTDLTYSNQPVLADLDTLIEEAAVANAECAAFHDNYDCYPDEPKAQKAMSRILRDMFPDEDDLPF